MKPKCMHLPLEKTRCCCLCCDDDEEDDKKGVTLHVRNSKPKWKGDGTPAIDVDSGNGVSFLGELCSRSPRREISIWIYTCGPSQPGRASSLCCLSILMTTSESHGNEKKG